MNSFIPAVKTGDINDAYVIQNLVREGLITHEEIGSMPRPQDLAHALKSYLIKDRNRAHRNHRWAAHMLRQGLRGKGPRQRSASSPDFLAKQNTETQIYDRALRAFARHIHRHKHETVQAKFGHMSNAVSGSIDVSVFVNDIIAHLPKPQLQNDIAWMRNARRKARGLKIFRPY